MPVLTLLYGSECWPPRKKRDLRYIKLSEIKFIRLAKGVLGEIGYEMQPLETNCWTTGINV